jgi:hypothetical protein
MLRRELNENLVESSDVFMHVGSNAMNRFRRMRPHG